uniref:Uncharacterized protein n=1 Tax=Cucumis melo TaxID=3656 RepID=A0A9I9D397_CUCME
MAARGSRERSSHTTGQPDIIGLGSINSGGTGGKGVSLPPTKQLGFGSASSIDLLEISDLAQVGANVNRPEADTICLANPGRGIYQLQFKDDDSNVSSNCSSKSEKSSGSPCPTSVSQVSGLTHESGGNVLSPTQSPSLQTMDRMGGYDESYDPFRIPSAVFQRSSSVTPMEWSIASNESLFSIQVGNNSFSRDHVSMLSEFGKSGELTKSGKFKKADESFVFSQPPAVITSREAEMKSAEYEEGPKMADTIEYNIKDKGGSITDDDLSDRNLPPPAVSWNSSTKSRHSDKSQSSSDSFAFPILFYYGIGLPQRRSAHAHRVTVLTVVRRSATARGHVATLHGQTVVAGTVAGRSAIVGTVAEEDFVVAFRPLKCMLRTLQHY